MLVVFLALPKLLPVYPAFQKPKPTERPEGFPDGQGGWPLYFATLSFEPSRAFGMYYILGLILDVALRYWLPAFWH
jgi:1,4-dihydroxy-2-naphthoate octaprenyltransferase